MFLGFTHTDTVLLFIHFNCYGIPLYENSVLYYPFSCYWVCKWFTAFYYWKQCCKNILVQVLFCT